MQTISSGDREQQSEAAGRANAQLARGAARDKEQADSQGEGNGHRWERVMVLSKKEVGGSLRCPRHPGATGPQAGTFDYPASSEPTRCSCRCPVAAACSLVKRLLGRRRAHAWRRHARRRHSRPAARGGTEGMSTRSASCIFNPMYASMGSLRKQPLRSRLLFGALSPEAWGRGATHEGRAHPRRRHTRRRHARRRHPRPANEAGERARVQRCRGLSMSGCGEMFAEGNFEKLPPHVSP